MVAILVKAGGTNAAVIHAPLRSLVVGDEKWYLQKVRNISPPGQHWPLKKMDMGYGDISLM